MVCQRDNATRWKQPFTLCRVGLQQEPVLCCTNIIACITVLSNARNWWIGTPFALSAYHGVRTDIYWCIALPAVFVKRYEAAPRLETWWSFKTRRRGREFWIYIGGLKGFLKKIVSSLMSHPLALTSYGSWRRSFGQWEGMMQSTMIKQWHHTVFLIHYLEFASVRTDHEAIKSQTLHVFIDILILRCRPLWKRASVTAALKELNEFPLVPPCFPIMWINLSDVAEPLFCFSSKLPFELAERTSKGLLFQ